MLVIGACLGGCAVIANISSGDGVGGTEAGTNAPPIIPAADGMVPVDEAGVVPCAPGGNSSDGPSKIHA